MAALAALDPKPGQMPPRELRGPSERVLHLFLSRNGGPCARSVALAELGSTGYVEVPVLREDTTKHALAAAAQLRPTVVFSQTQAPSLDAAFFRSLRNAAGNPKELVIVNWSGDMDNHNAPSLHALQWAVEAATEVDVTAWVSLTHVDLLRSAGVPSVYLQAGYDKELFFEATDEEWGTAFDVAFLFHEHHPNFGLSLGRHNDCPARTEAGAALRAAFGQRATVGATQSEGVTASATYRKTRLAVSISGSCTLERCTSNRLFHAMAATATAVKRFTGHESFGLKHEENCLLFNTTEELIALAQHWTKPEQRQQLRQIRRAGAALARADFTWHARVQELRPILAAVRQARV